MITLNETAKPVTIVDTHKGAIIYNSPNAEIVNGICYFDFPLVFLKEGDEFEITVKVRAENGILRSA